MMRGPAARGWPWPIQITECVLRKEKGMSERPDYEMIERAYTWTRDEIIGKLPECTESKRALDHLKLAEDYTYHAREKAGPVVAPEEVAE